ncbi:MAG: hypothetical protein ACREV8_08675, partial [Gammaproteobacteria bacterium]
APLTEGELRQGSSDALNAALEQGGFLQKTPLWYYVLNEAEVRANGNSLGEVVRPHRVRDDYRLARQ